MIRVSARTVVLLALLVAGCGGAGVRVRVFDRVRDRPTVRAVVLLPSEYMLRGMKAWDPFEKDLDLAEHLSSRHGLAVYAADEYRILAGISVLLDLRAETSIPLALAADGLDPSSALALRVTLTENVQTDAMTITGAGGADGAAGRGFRSTLFLDLEVFHVGSNEPLAAVSLRRRIDPFARALDHDPAPWYRETLLDGVDRLLAAVQGRVRLPGPTAPEQRHPLTPPAEALAATWGDEPSASSRLRDGDPLLRDAATLERARYREPTATPPQLRALAELERGLLVGDAPLCSGLAAGDVLLSADDVPLTRTYQWRRVVRTRPSRPLALAVRRGGQEIEVSYTCPPGG